MPSVIARYSGQCDNAADRVRLLTHVERLAAASEDLIASAPPLGGFLELTSSLRMKNFIRPPTLRSIKQKLTGNILVDLDLFEDQPRVLALARKQHIEIVSDSTQPTTNNGKRTSDNGQLTMDNGPLTRSKPAFLRIGRVYARGIDFRLYDYRNLYPSEDRLTFIFFDHPTFAPLRGILAQADPGRLYGHPTVQAADWFITRPGIHLRYYLEDWFDMFMGWTKAFFIPNLWYWRYEDLPNWKQWGDIFCRSIHSIDTGPSKTIEDFTIEHLIDSFREQAHKWEEDMQKI